MKLWIEIIDNRKSANLHGTLGNAGKVKTRPTIDFIICNIFMRNTKYLWCLTLIFSPELSRCLVLDLTHSENGIRYSHCLRRKNIRYLFIFGGGGSIDPKLNPIFIFHSPFDRVSHQMLRRSAHYLVECCTHMRFQHQLYIPPQ